jgi:lambda family phage tail tape measure protein
LLGASKKTVKDLQLGIDIEVFGKARDLFITGISASFAKGSELIAKALGQSAEKAALAVAQAGIGALTGARAAQETTRLKQEEIKIQMSQIDSTIQLITSNTLLTATMNESNARMALAQADKDKAPAIVLEFKRAEVKAAEIFKNAMDDVAKGKLKTSDLGSIAQTEDPAVNASLRASIIKVQRETAAQTASKIELGGKSQANVIEGERALALARLEDLNKQRNLQNDINQQFINREDILAGIDTLNAVQRVQEKIRLENLNLDTKQLQEIEGYTTAITNAEALGTDKGQEEAKRQEELLLKVRERLTLEKDNKGITDRLKLKTTEFEVATKLNALNEAILDQDISRLGILSSLMGFSSEQNVLATQRLENEKLENKFALERKKLEEELKQLQDDKAKDNIKSIALKQVELQLVTNRQEKEKDNKGLQDALKLVQSRFDLEQKLAGFRKTIADAQSQQTEDELNYRKELGLVTSQEFAKEKANLERGKLARETEQQQAEIDKKIAEKDLLRDKLAQIDPSDIANPDDIRNYLQMNDVIVAQSAALQATNQQKMNAIDLTESLASKMTSFSKIVEGGFLSMADALADFARTGKLDFKGLVDSMILDLIRFELRAQMSSLYAGGGGLGGMIGSLIGGVSRIGTPASLNNAGSMVTGYQGEAKGGVYDAGLRTFAKGGMFTNSVVNEPTLFKFARGTGLMGEAGPEAIMPLKRDSNGNLGVRSGGGSSVDVVVNNYGSEKATTKETTDSRGNRRIEVIVGDMVAGELSRPGSSVQQSLSNNFGSRPAVARR